LELMANGQLRGSAFTSWDQALEAGRADAEVGELRTKTPCELNGAEPGPAPEQAMHRLSGTPICIELALSLLPGVGPASNAPAALSPFDASLQWYDRELAGAAVAVVRPGAASRARWLLVLSEYLLSPAGPWLAVRVGDVDGDALSDVAFVAQGVDGCDRGPCPLFWIDLLMSQVHTLVSRERATLVSTDDLERLTGTRPWTDWTWRAQLRGGRYEVKLVGARRAEAWSALVEKRADGGRELAIFAQRAAASSSPR
jgi:hypothetical protein